jgi:hypothetical protein
MRHLQPNILRMALIRLLKCYQVEYIGVAYPYPVRNFTPQETLSFLGAP